MSAPTYEDALAIVREHRKASPSLIQRKLGVGYQDALDWIQRMEREGVCHPPTTAGVRQLIAQP